MENRIGIVKQVNGTAYAVVADGSKRELHANSPVYPNETIETADGSAIAIVLANGKLLDLGRNDRMDLDTAVGPEGAGKNRSSEVPHDVTPAKPSLTVEQIQQLILEGADPTAIAEATAAGNVAVSVPAQSDEGGHSFVSIDYSQPRVAPESGFETKGISYQFSPTRPEQFILQVSGSALSPNPAPGNHPPQPQDDNATGAADDALTTPEDTALTIAPATLLANDSDPDGDPLTIVSVQNPPPGTVPLGADGQIVYTPTADYNGPASFTYTVRAPAGATATATVPINVTPANDPPADPLDPAAIGEHVAE
ncbi:MAG: retention module-containing protein, partial [Methylococcaceae bacterium]|nr:retention module-containing protein [Methylococcaceae bacterium]